LSFEFLVAEEDCSYKDFAWVPPADSKSNPQKGTTIRLAENLNYG
jgi:hypothetical protein